MAAGWKVQEEGDVMVATLDFMGITYTEVGDPENVHCAMTQIEMKLLRKYGLSPLARQELAILLIAGRERRMES